MMPLRWLNRAENADFTLVAIHGWAANGDVWQLLAGELPDVDFAVFDLPGFRCTSELVDVETVIAAMAKALNGRDAPNVPIVLMGWSLGGQLATLLATKLIESGHALRALITLASNPCFVANDDWQAAMPQAQFEAFLAGFEVNSQATLSKFHRLQERGAIDKRSLRAAMAGLPIISEACESLWREALNWLRLDTRELLAKLAVPQLHILAAGDALVPSEAPLGQFGEMHTVQGSHCLPLELPQQIARSFSVFLASHSEESRTKSQVAAAFSRAADHYDNFAKVQKTVACRVANLTETLLVEGETLLDLGTGTGSVLKYLNATRHQLEWCLGLDIAEGMVRRASAAAELEGCLLGVADIEKLPIRHSSIDVAVSSLAMQWCSDLTRLFAGLLAVLKPNGKAVIATLGPETLCELKAAWRHVDANVHVNGFANCAVLTKAAERAGFRVKLERQIEQLTYPDLMPLLRELKAIGAHNMHTHARRGLMTRSVFAALKEAYAKTSSGEFMATYDVYYLMLEKADG